MLAQSPISPWHWLGFITAVLVFLALDLGVFHRKARVVHFREALGWTTLSFLLAMAFALYFVRPHLGADGAKLFIAGYITELSLSMDNVFVMALIFGYFRVPEQYQHRVLFWGIIGALVMRGVMIGVGTAVIHTFEWTLYLFGAFLVFTGIRMSVAEDEGVDPEKNPVIRLARTFYPIAPHFDGQKFLTRVDGRRALTPLAVVLLMVETTDLVFAVDSIPAIFGLTQNPFIVFTSNVFAIICLRSLYFTLAGMMRYFRFLKIGLSVVLVFIGVKMLLDPHLEPGSEAEPLWFQVEIDPNVSLAVVGSIIFVSMITSVMAARWERRAPGQPPANPDDAPPPPVDGPSPGNPS
jgi:tellurite resistance protein TerC